MALLDTTNKRIAVAAILLVVAIAMFVMHKRNQQEAGYFHNRGDIFGTTYHIVYQYETDLEGEIRDAMIGVDNSLSRFNPKSTISRINEGGVETDAHFVKVFNKAEEIYKLSDGAFDITISPLIDAWGFGKSDHPQVDKYQIDVLLLYVGFDKVRLINNQIIKDDPRVDLDASAIAKGYGCDVVANLLSSKDIHNFMVEIGGEIVCRGLNDQGEPWRVGISKPLEDLTGKINQAQEVVCGDLNLATSGTYRQFYYEDGIRRSHTIDPRTGYPTSNSLVSATIIAPDCMTADGLATACMVMGVDESIEMIEKLEDTECYLIYNDGVEHKVRQSSGFGKYIVK